MAEAQVDLDALASDDNVAVDRVAGRDYQYVKVAFGADDTVNKVGSVSSNPLPVALSSTDNQVLDDILTALQILDNVVAGGETQVDVISSALPSGAATEATLSAIQTAVEVIDNAIAGTEMQVDIVSGSVGVTGTVTVDGSGVTQPISAASLPLPSGAATAALQTTGNTALSAIQTAVQLIDNAISGSEMQVDVVASLPAGTNNIGDVDIASAIPAGANLIGDVGISGARTSGGTTLYRNIDVDESEDQIKGSAGQLYWLHAMNVTSAVLYLQVYNATAASVTVGTTTPDLTFPIPTQGDTNGAGFVLAIPNGIAFSTAITIAATTTVSGSAGPAANGCVVNAGYA